MHHEINGAIVIGSIGFPL